MRLTSIGLVFIAASVLACNDGGGDTGTSPATTGDATTDGPITTGGPTSAPDATSTGDVTTGDATTGAPAAACSGFLDEAACAAAPGCAWDDVFVYTHGDDGCQATSMKFCVADDGQASTWYHGEEGEEEVVQFSVTPSDLPPDWKQCDCDGPLACFCTLNAPECPARYQEFCGATEAEEACQNATINGQNLCNWFRIFPEGPPDDTCTTMPLKDLCLHADMAAADTCTKLDLSQTYPDACTNDMPPVYWRMLDGLVEITSICGPVPPSPEWTACSETDTAEQPDECKCACI